MSAYRIPLPRQIIRIQRIRAQIFPVNFDIRRTIHIQTRNVNFCLRVSASASRSVWSRVNFFVIVECSSPLRAPAAAPASTPGLAPINDFYIAALRACARTGGAGYAYCAFRYGEHAIGCHGDALGVLGLDHDSAVAILIIRVGIVVRAGPRHVSWCCSWCPTISADQPYRGGYSLAERLCGWEIGETRFWGCRRLSTLQKWRIADGASIKSSEFKIGQLSAP